MTHTSVQALIDSWPSLTAFAKDAGVTYGAAKQMRRRGSIPAAYWQSLISKAADRGQAVQAEEFVRLHALSEPAAA